MLIVGGIIESEAVEKYILSRGLLKQYQKAKENILAGRTNQVDLKLRKPKHLGIWSFRINDKYRAIAAFRDDVLAVYEIDDHQ